MAKIEGIWLDEMAKPVGEKVFATLEKRVKRLVKKSGGKVTIWSSPRQ